MPLLLRTLASLELAGCDRIAIVVGHAADAVRASIEEAYDGPLALEFVFNPDFELKNGVSVLCARPHVGDEFVLTMADHIFDDDIMALVRDHHPPAGGATHPGRPFGLGEHVGDRPADPARTTRHEDTGAIEVSHDRTLRERPLDGRRAEASA